MRKKNNKDLRSMSKMELEVRRQKAATARKTSQVQYCTGGQTHVVDVGT